jgi:NADH:ubiquinone reductase (H+-translocating)
MAYVIKKYTKSIGESTKEIHIHLIDAAPTILPGMSRYIIDKTHQRLEKLGIHIMTNAFIDNVDKNIITLKDGRTLPYYFMIFTGGIKVPGIAINCDVERNRINQFITNEFLQLPQAPDVYAIGDCVELHDRNGAILPPTAQTAERSAEHVAESIKNILNLGQPQPFHGRVDGVFVALGGHYAVGELFGIIKVSGSLAYLLKKLITYIYYIGLKFKVNTGFKKRTVSRP